MGFFQNVYALLFRPQAAFKELSYEYNSKLVLQAALIFLISGIITSKGSPSEFLSYTLNLLQFSLIIFLLSKVFQNRDEIRFGKICSFLAIAGLPLVFMGPLSVYHQTHPMLSALLGFAVSIWYFYLSMHAISAACNISKNRVILFYSIPVIIFIASIISLILQISL